MSTFLLPLEGTSTNKEPERFFPISMKATLKSSNYSFNGISDIVPLFPASPFHNLVLFQIFLLPHYHQNRSNCFLSDHLSMKGGGGEVLYNGDNNNFTLGHYTCRVNG